MEDKLKRLINTVYVIIRYMGEIYYDVVRIDEFSSDDKRISDIKHIIHEKADVLPTWFQDIEDFTNEEIFTGNGILPVPSTAEIIGVDTKKEAWQTALFFELEDFEIVEENQEDI